VLARYLIGFGPFARTMSHSGHRNRRVAAKPSTAAAARHSVPSRPAPDGARLPPSTRQRDCEPAEDLPRSRGAEIDARQVRAETADGKATLRGAAHVIARPSARRRKKPRGGVARTLRRGLAAADSWVSGSCGTQDQAGRSLEQRKPRHSVLTGSRGRSAADRPQGSIWC
jgi:hypothetical protein